MIYIATSNGIIVYDEILDTTNVVIPNKHTLGFFKKKAMGWFGLCIYGSDGFVLAGSREKLGSKSIGRSSTDVKLHLINPHTLQHEVIGKVKSVYDLHQMAAWKSLVFLTDTGLNRVHVYDVNLGATISIVNIGDKRADVNHINALNIDGENLFIGLNNKDGDSQLLKIDLNRVINYGVSDNNALIDGELISLPGTSHSHDIEVYRSDLLVCASHDGCLIRVSNGEILFDAMGWARGIAISPEGIWVGESPLAERSKRHNKSLSGAIHLYSHDRYELIKSIKIEASGQICDLLHINVHPELVPA